MEIRKAERKNARVRVALIAPSGGGKTYSALRVAKGLGNYSIVIDTENRRSEYYAAEFNFDILDLDPPFTPERYIEAIQVAEKAGADTIIIDSASHEWMGRGGILQIADSMPGENSFTKWKTLTPRHDAFIDAIVRSKAHIILTLRGKDEYVLSTNDKGKQAPKKVGVGAQQRDGIEYEMTCAFTLDQESHVATVSKDNTHLFEGAFTLLTEDHGKALKAWAESGAPMEPRPEEKKPDQGPTLHDRIAAARQKFVDILTDPIFTDEDRKKAKAKLEVGKETSEGYLSYVNSIVNEYEGKRKERQSPTIPDEAFETPKKEEPKAAVSGADLAKKFGVEMPKNEPRQEQLY